MTPGSTPALPSHAEACAAFSWQTSLTALGWAADGPVDLAGTLVGRHAGSGRPAVRWFGKGGPSRTLSFDELARLASRFAGFLSAQGVTPGDRVAGFLPRVPETVAVMLGAWKTGAVYVPIFTGFGPDAVAFRLRHSGSRVLCTHRELRDRVPPLDSSTTVVEVDHDASGRAGAASSSSISFVDAIAGQAEHRQSVLRRRDDPAVLLYTSGSTGPPKGVAIATNFPMAVHPYMTLGIGLRPDDVFWPTGDPGWGYGLVCYMVALAMGVAVVCHEAQPTPEVALRRIAELGVTSLATTPTLLRGIMALGESAVRAHPVRLRCASSCGEPLNAEVVSFFRAAWGVTVMDHYGASEFGLPIGNLNGVAMEVRPGSMGLPLPGCRMAVVDDAGAEVKPGVIGHVGMMPSPVGYYALGYWDEPGRSWEGRRGGWITIGDLARRDADGYFWFEGRADDVIKSAGYRIGPFEVESAILEHPAVAEAAVVGVPDALRGQVVKAYVVLRPDISASPGLAGEIADLVRRRVGRHQYPRQVEVVTELPKTETGKIQRFKLRRR